MAKWHRDPLWQDDMNAYFDYEDYLKTKGQTVQESMASWITKRQKVRLEVEARALAIRQAEAERANNV